MQRVRFPVIRHISKRRDVFDGSFGGGRRRMKTTWRESDTSFCTSGLSKLRPIKRLTAVTVLAGSCFNHSSACFPTIHSVFSESPSNLFFG